MPLDAKSFEFETLGSKKVEFEALNILKSSLDAKSFDLWWTPVCKSKNIQIEAFSIQKHDPRILKLSKFEVFELQDLEFEVFNRFFRLNYFWKNFK